MDEDLGKAFVGEITGRTNDVQLVCLGGEVTIAPGLHDGPAPSKDRQVGLEFTNAALTQRARIEG